MNKKQLDATYYFIVLLIGSRLNMFRALLCPSSGARECDVDYHIGRFVLGLLYVGGLSRGLACSPDTTPA